MGHTMPPGADSPTHTRPILDPYFAPTSHFARHAEVNGVVAWRAGEVPRTAYEGFRVVDRRRYPELAGVAAAAAVEARRLRLRRVCGERGFEHPFQAAAWIGERVVRVEEGSEWPVVADRDAWRLYRGRWDTHAVMERRTPAAPGRAVSPGEILRALLRQHGITQAEFAERLGRPVQVISEIMNGKKAITADTALDFEQVLGIGAQFWCHLQADHALAKARMRRNQGSVGTLT